MKAIFKREFKAFFTSPQGYVFIAANLFLIGIYFTAYNLHGAYPYFSYTLDSSIIIFFVTIPVLTMRVLSEERRNKTDQLILTAPVSVGKIVLGKYLAVSAVLGIVMAVVSLYPLIMSLYGNVPMKEAYTAILGFTLYGLAAASVGLFISGITESQIIAALISFAFLFASYFCQGICSLISSTGNFLTKILGAFDFLTPFDTFMNGSLDIKAVIYYLSVILLMLFLTSQGIQKRRYSVSVKSFAMGAYSTVSIIITIAAAVFVNMIVAQIPERYTTFDTTSNKMYSISNETKEALRSLDKDVKLYIYSKEGSYDTTVEELLKRYEGQTSHISIEYINPALYPTFTQKYTTTNVSTGSIIVECGDRSRVIDYNELYETETSMDYTTYNYTTTTTGFDAEGQLTSAIAYVTGEDMPLVTYTQGHGEAELSGILTDAISKSNMDTQAVTLLTDGKIPDNTEFVIINAPSEDFSDDDCKVLKEYIEKGGKVLVNLLAKGEEYTNLWGLLSEYGFNVTNSVVMESDQSNYYQYPPFLLPEILSDDMTASVKGAYYIFAPYSVGMTIADSLPTNITITNLLTTSDSAYAKNATKEMSTYEYEEGDEKGTFIVAARAEIVNKDGSEAIIVVNTSGEMFTDSADKMVAKANSKFFTGILTGLSDLEMTVSIPSKSIQADYLTLSSAQIGIWRLVTMVLLPFGLIITGIFVWAGRRKK